MDFIERKKLRKSRLLKTRMNRSFGNIFASFSVTAVVAVSATTMIQSIPTASFISLEAIANHIYYEVEVTDSSSLIVSDSLTISLQSNFETITQPLIFGQNSGYFEALKYDTDYTINISANYGFGIGVLKSANVKTSAYFFEPPTAEFIQVDVLGTTLTYEIEINQSNNSNELISYRLKATSSLDSFFVDLSTGYNEGIYDELSPNLQYLLTSESNRNGSISVLDSETIQTGDYYEAKLNNLHQTQRINMGYENEAFWMNSYQVDGIYVDK